MAIGVPCFCYLSMLLALRLLFYSILECLSKRTYDSSRHPMIFNSHWAVWLLLKAMISFYYFLWYLFLFFLSNFVWQACTFCNLHSINIGVCVCFWVLTLWHSFPCAVFNFLSLFLPFCIPVPGVLCSSVSKSWKLFGDTNVTLMSLNTNSLASCWFVFLPYFGTGKNILLFYCSGKTTEHCWKAVYQFFCYSTKWGLG